MFLQRCSFQKYKPCLRTMNFGTFDQFGHSEDPDFFLLHLSSEVTWWVMWWGGRAKSIEPSCPMITYISSTLPNHTYYAFRGCSNDLQRHFIITRCKASEKTRDVDYHQQMHQEIYRIRIFIVSSFSAFSEHSHCLKYVNVLLNETFSVIFKHRAYIMFFACNSSFFETPNPSIFRFIKPQVNSSYTPVWFSKYVNGLKTFSEVPPQMGKNAR